VDGTLASEPVPAKAPKDVTVQATTTTDVIGSRGTVFVDTDDAGALPNAGVILKPTNALYPDVTARITGSSSRFSVVQGTTQIFSVLGDGRAMVNAPASFTPGQTKLTVLNATHANFGTALTASLYGGYTGGSVSEAAASIEASEIITAPNANTGFLTGLKANAWLGGTGTLSAAVGVLADAEVDPAAGNTGTITEAKGLLARVLNRNGVITRGYGVFIEDVGATTAYGIYQDGANDGNIFHGAVTIGQPAALSNLTVNGDATFSGVVTGGNIRAKYQDVAEWVPATHDLTPGTVVVLNKQKTNEVMASAVAYDTAVAGVVSDQPGLSLGVEGTGKEQVATTGRVKVRVDARTAPIHVGDLLVTSDVAGTAMRSEPMTINGRSFHQPGTIIGKALEPLDSGMGEILVLLSMQ